MTIDLKEFFIKGNINGIKPGISKDEFSSQYPIPDGFDGYAHLFMDNSGKKHPNIWTYGDIEFHFNNDGVLFMIWCDHIGDFFGKLKAGPSIQLERWFLKNKTTIRCIDLIKILNQENLDFNRFTNKYSGSVELSLHNGICFSFHLESHWSEDAELVRKRKKETSFNDYKLSAFSLINEDFIN